MQSLWLFWVAPIVGGIIGGLIGKALYEKYWDSQIGRVLIQHAGWDGGQHGWANLIQWIFASGWLARLRLEACPATRRRHNSAWA